MDGWMDERMKGKRRKQGEMGKSRGKGGRKREKTGIWGSGSLLCGVGGGMVVGDWGSERRGGMQCRCLVCVCAA